MWEYKHTDELMHYGILGMKWGVRRSKAQLARARKKEANQEPDHEDYTKAHTPKSIRAMSTDELNSRNKRLQAENQYKKLTKKTSKGKKIIDGFTTTATTIAAVGTAYKTYKNVAKPIIEKVGKHAVKNVTT